MMIINGVEFSFTEWAMLQRGLLALKARREKIMADDARIRANMPDLIKGEPLDFANDISNIQALMEKLENIPSLASTRQDPPKS